MTLQLQGVGYRYPGAGRWAIEGIDLSVADAEIVGVIGANDSGKSTLCLAAAGLAPASIGGDLDGEVVVDGESLKGRPVHELAGLTGIVLADPSTQLSGIVATVFEEVALGPVNLGHSRAESIEATREALATLGIDDLWERHPGRLSGGQAQLVAIASMLAMRPRVLVLDEPTAQLDPDATDRVVAGLRAVTASGAAVLVAEHRMDVLEALADRVVELANGRIASEIPR